MFVLVQVQGKVQAQQQPTGICPSMIVLQEQGEAPGAQKQTWCMKTGPNSQMDSKMQKY